MPRISLMPIYSIGKVPIVGILPIIKKGKNFEFRIFIFMTVRPSVYCKHSTYKSIRQILWKKVSLFLPIDSIDLGL